MIPLTSANINQLQLQSFYIFLQEDQKISNLYSDLPVPANISQLIVALHEKKKNKYARSCV